MNLTFHQTWLLELTALPTAAGHEGRIIDWVTRWARARRQVELAADRFGNLVLRRRRIRSTSGGPIYFTAHMDHPAFVVRSVNASRPLVAEFRGGVADSFFIGSRVVLHPGSGGGLPVEGVVRSLQPATDSDFKSCDIELDAPGTTEFPAAAQPGDVLTWSVGPQRVENDRLYTPACDDLAGVAAALAAFDVLCRKRVRSDIRVLLTRAEETGFLGAIAACKASTIPKTARVIALENSKSFADSPIGGGPIVRVGDRTSTFDPDLTYRIGKMAEELAGKDKTFQWQRKLMPGGTCEASAYQSYGYTATCLCLPLGNYHNMDETTGKIAAETISLSDFHGLVRLLVAVGQRLDSPAKSPPLRKRLDELFAKRKWVL